MWFIGFREGSSSFLKKRTKKLLTFWYAGGRSAMALAEFALYG
jgi:hypothetical protein